MKHRKFCPAYNILTKQILAAGIPLPADVSSVVTFNDIGV